MDQTEVSKDKLDSIAEIDCGGIVGKMNDQQFDIEKDKRDESFDSAVTLYRAYISTSVSDQERKERIKQFRCR